MTHNKRKPARVLIQSVATELLLLLRRLIQEGAMLLIQTRNYSKKVYVQNRSVNIEGFKVYYKNHKNSMCANRRARYILQEPKSDVKELYLKEMRGHMLGDFKAANMQGTWHDLP